MPRKSLALRVVGKGTGSESEVGSPRVRRRVSRLLLTACLLLHRLLSACSASASHALSVPLCRFLVRFLVFIGSGCRQSDNSAPSVCPFNVSRANVNVIHIRVVRVSLCRGVFKYSAKENKQQQKYMGVKLRCTVQ